MTRYTKPAGMSLQDKTLLTTMSVVLLAVLLLGAWTFAFAVYDGWLAWKQPIVVTKRDQCRARVDGVSFWPEGLLHGQMHWPPFAYSVTWGDRTLNSAKWFAEHPRSIRQPSRGFVYVDEVDFE